MCPSWDGPSWAIAVFLPLARPVTCVNDLNLTVMTTNRENTLSDARFAEGYNGETDSILCPAKLQTTEAALAAFGATREDHRVPNRCDQEVCLNVGRSSSFNLRVAGQHTIELIKTGSCIPGYGCSISSGNASRIVNGCLNLPLLPLKVHGDRINVNFPTF